MAALGLTAWLLNGLAVKVAAMRGGVFMTEMRNGRFWQPFVGVIVAYAVAAQSLLIALGGFALPAGLNDGAPAFELCVHDGQGASKLPASNPDHSPCTHCIFCFAGSHHAVISATPALSHRIDIEVVVAAPVANGPRQPGARAHSIASPRGPPLVA